MHPIKRCVCLLTALCMVWGAAGLISVAAEETQVVEGTYTPFPMVFPTEDMHIDDVFTAIYRGAFHNGDTLYASCFQDERGVLGFKTLQLDTMQVSQAMLGHDFGDETLLSWKIDDGLFRVFTDRAIYTFDAALQLVQRTPWPASLLALMKEGEEEDEDEEDGALDLWSVFDINPSGTHICFEANHENALVEYGSINVCALTPDAEPRRILPAHTVFADDDVAEEGYRYPSFVRDDRIHVINMGWEWRLGWEVHDLEGRLLFNSFIFDDGEEADRRVADDVDGLLMHDPTSSSVPNTFYFDYATLELDRLPVLSLPPYRDEWGFCAINGRTCYFAVNQKNLYGRTTQVNFYRYDIGAMTVERLPLTLHDVLLSRAVLLPGERILFAYQHDVYGDESAGIIQCP